MTVLALDVGFDNTGWAVMGTDRDAGKDIIVDVGCITTSKSPKKTKVRLADENAMRGAQIASKLAQIVREWGCHCMIGEMPSGGAQSALSMRAMAAATTAVSATAAVLEIPAEWCSPTDVKLATFGLKSATKDEVMNAVVEKYDWWVDKKSHYTTITRGKRKGEKKLVVCKTFHVPCSGEFKTRKIPGGTFEHIADAIGAYWAMRDSNLVRMFGYI